MMNILTFVAAALCVTAVVGAPASPTPPSCAILDQTWKLWDVSTNYYNVTDKYGIISANLCLDMERSCAHTTNEPCSVCQYLSQDSPDAHSYCVGYSRNEVYSPLNKTVYPNDVGFRATLLGDECGNDIPHRTTFIDVLCNSPQDFLYFVDENPTCTYNFKLYQRGACQWSANSFQPTFSIPMKTATSVTISIDDGYPYMYWSYTITFNGVVAYSGDNRYITVEGLVPSTNYNIVVNRVSGQGAVTSVTAPSATLSTTTLPQIAPTQKATPKPDPTDAPTQLPVTHTVVVSEKGAGIAIGMVIAGAIVGGLFGLYKVTQSAWWAEKFGGGKKGGFSLMDAEKSNAFE